MMMPPYQTLNQFQNFGLVMFPNEKLHPESYGRKQGRRNASTDGKMTPLPPNFVPGQFDVICARGAKVKQHSANQLFRKKIEDSVKDYSEAATKFHKSLVVSGVVDFFRERSEGGFVKQVDGAWYSVGDNLAREKVGQAYRERLSHQYRSSTKAKRLRWRQEEEDKKEAAAQRKATKKSKKSSDLPFSSSETKTSYASHEPSLNQSYQELVFSNQDAVNRINALDSQKATFDQNTDAELLILFSQHNIELLRLFKRDPKIQGALTISNKSAGSY